LCNSHLAVYQNPKSGLPSDRKDMIESLKSSSVIDFWNTRLEQDITFEKTREYKYALCPEGNGIDTHRFYECYYLGVLPVVKKGALTRLHSQFPGTVVVDKWSDVENIDVQKSIGPTDKKMVTLSYWLYKSLVSRCKILNFVTIGSCKLWKNFLYSLRKLNLEHLLVVFVMDSESRDYVVANNIYGKFTVNTEFVQSDVAKEACFGSAEFRNIVSYKLKAIVKMLEENYIVFYHDVDIVLFKDPIEHYFTLPYKNIYFQSDNAPFLALDLFCTGVMYIQPEKNIISMFKKACEECSSQGVGNDQDIINNYIKDKIIDMSNIGLLDLYLYPNGARYFSDVKFDRSDAYLIHNNWIVSNKNKENRFKEHRLWFIED
jgi:hypothetical protein